MHTLTAHTVVVYPHPDHVYIQLAEGVSKMFDYLTYAMSQHPITGIVLPALFLFGILLLLFHRHNTRPPSTDELNRSIEYLYSIGVLDMETYQRALSRTSKY